MKYKKVKESVLLNLNADEALVLFEWLTRFNEQELPELFEDDVEERILFDLETNLEKSITGILGLDYKELLLLARDRLIDA